MMDETPLFLDEDDLYLEEEAEATTVPSGDAWLPTDDYNLNSPLMRDRVDQLISRLSGKLTCPERDSLGKLISLNNLQGSAQFHRFAVDHFLQSSKTPTNDALRILKDVETGISAASLVHDAFWKHFGNTIIVPTLNPKWLTSYYDKDFRFRKDFEGYWFLHRLIVLLNLTSSDVDPIIRSKLFDNIQVDPQDKNPTVSIDHPVYERVVLRDGICIFDKWRQVLDRNMVLALKDTLIGRCAVKLVTYQRTDQHVPDCQRLWKRWFETGDSLLSKHTNES